jgi:hypothetical protein
MSKKNSKGEESNEKTIFDDFVFHLTLYFFPSTGKLGIWHPLFPLGNGLLHRKPGKRRL